MSPLDRSYRPPYLGTVRPSPAARLRAHVEQTRARAIESQVRQAERGDQVSGKPTMAQMNLLRWVYGAGAPVLVYRADGAGPDWATLGRSMVRVPTLRALERAGLMERTPWEGHYEHSTITDAGKQALAEALRVLAGAREGVER